MLRAKAAPFSLRIVVMAFLQNLMRHCKGAEFVRCRDRSNRANFLI